MISNCSVPATCLGWERQAFGVACLQPCNRSRHAKRTLGSWSTRYKQNYEEDWRQTVWHDVRLQVIVWYHVTDGAAGPPPLEGPLKVDRCMSCDMDCPLELGVAGTCGDNANPGPTAGDSLLSESALHRVWIDGKGATVRAY